MPINVPTNLPAVEELKRENIFIMEESRALHQDIRPLRIALLNLMPVKMVTETDLLRSLANTALQLELDLLHMDKHESKHTPREHMEVFYKTFDEVKHRRYDGLIITGAPVEHLEFEQVDYWDHLCEVLEWSKTNVSSTMHICWGAQAGLYYHYGIQKFPRDRKAFGIFDHRITDRKHHLVRGFDDLFPAPHSRYTENRLEDLKQHPDLVLLANDGFDVKGWMRTGEVFGTSHFTGMHNWDDAFFWSTDEMPGGFDITSIAGAIERRLIGGD